MNRWIELLVLMVFSPMTNILRHVERYRTICAPRERLSSATTGSQRAALGASRGRLSSATTTSQWAALRKTAVCNGENPVVKKDKDCVENTPVDVVAKSCAEAKSCVVHGVDEAEANA